ncbi:MAG: hypothetical protein APR63_07695 [Desulfuromonas sp. SDB]|nr:MAG: hypothetical protein APR63_07695 [Desulfuromonas sp. SDB]
MNSYEYINIELEKIHRECNLSYWDHLVNNEPLHREKILNKYRPFFYDREIISFIHRNLGKLEDKLEKRKWLLLKSYFSRKMIEYDQEINAAFEQASDLMLDKAVKIEGKKFGVMELQSKINCSENAEEKKHYTDLKDKFFNQYKQKILNIINRRNYLSKKQGYSSFLDLCLVNDDISYEQLKNIIFSLKDELIKITRNDLIQKESRKNFNDNNEVSSKYFSINSGYDLLNGFLNQWGISANYKGITFKKTDSTKESNQSNECIDISIPDDIRIFVNTKVPLSDYLYCLFHEFGHALHLASINTEDYIFKLTPAYYCEAMAGLVDKLLVLPESLGQYVDNEDELNIISKSIISSNYNIFLGNIIRFLFESELYEKELKVKEADNLYKKIMYQWTGLKERRNWGELFVSYVKFPFNEYSYIIANIISNQVISNIYRKFGSYLKPEVFDYIEQNYYQPGNEKPIQEILSESTEEDLNTDYFFRI